MKRITFRLSDELHAELLKEVRDGKNLTDVIIERLLRKEIKEIRDEKKGKFESLKEQFENIRPDIEDMRKRQEGKVKPVLHTEFGKRV